MATRNDVHSVRIPDDLWAWLAQEAPLRGLASRADLIAQLIARARDEASDTATLTPMPPSPPVAPTIDLAPLEEVLERTLCEAMQARMLTVEVMSYLIEGTADEAIERARLRGDIVYRRAKDATMQGKRATL